MSIYAQEVFISALSTRNSEEHLKGHREATCPLKFLRTNVDARVIFGVNGPYRVLMPALVALRSAQTVSSSVETRRGAS